MASGTTCSSAERIAGGYIAATLEECKAEAIEQGCRYIYFQDLSKGQYCHIYESCENTRSPADEGTNYDYGFWSADSSCDNSLTWC